MKIEGVFLFCITVLLAIGSYTIYYFRDSDRYKLSWIFVIILTLIALMFYLKERIKKAEDYLKLPETKYTYKP